MIKGAVFDESRPENGSRKDFRGKNRNVVKTMND